MPITDSDYVADRLYQRLFQPFSLPSSDHRLCREDWTRVDAICALPWRGRVLDIGAGDGTLGALVCSRNQAVTDMVAVEPDRDQNNKARRLWSAWPITRGATWPDGKFDGALCCEVLEHLTPDEAVSTLNRIHERLVPGALCCVTVPHPSGSRADFPGHVNLMNTEALTQALDDAGFDVGTVTTIGHPAIWIMVTSVA